MKHKFWYDFHIHTVLSPCGDDDMTPNNIAGMAKLIGLDVIAVTDHNAIGNAAAVIEASKRLNGPLVLPGMELETSEAIHLLMLFPDLRSASECEQIVNENRLRILNKPEIYGRQIFMDSLDNEVGEEETLLVVSTQTDLENARRIALDLGGVAIPAHIDKPANAVIAVLGAITPEMGFRTVEVSRHCSVELLEKLHKENYLVLYDSDAHYLESFNEKEQNFLELSRLDAYEVIEALRNRKNEI